MQSAADQERRRFQRIEFEAIAAIYSESSHWATKMLDISLKGVLLERPMDWDGETGQSYRIQLTLEGSVVISMSVTAAHITEKQIGFRCDRIDMDSFTHLKRLVELNLGAAELLNRELSALG